MSGGMHIIGGGPESAVPADYVVLRYKCRLCETTWFREHPLQVQWEAMRSQKRGRYGFEVPKLTLGQLAHTWHLCGGLRPSEKHKEDGVSDLIAVLRFETREAAIDRLGASLVVLIR